MGQMQPREGDNGKKSEGTNQTTAAKDRATVKNFQPRSAVNSASGMGKKENPGKPT